ncbi:hypothetical protein OEZ86_006892 [Tetradesmus obliquus]|nr:hypothetical protein OEZ86_006892 [Tetradesmus obliquus]
MFRGKQRRMRKQALWLCAVVLCALLCLPPVQAQPPTGSAAPAADEPSPGSDILEAFEFLIEILQKLLELLKLCLQLWAIRAALAPRPAGNVPQAGAGGANGVV